MPRRDLSTPLAPSSFDQNDPKKKKNSTSGATTTSPISNKANTDIKNNKSRSSDIVAKKGEYKGQKVDPRTNRPKGTSKPPSDMEAKNAAKISKLRDKMRQIEATNPFSPESEKIRNQISKLRGK
mgnify:CR=1 FL=1